MSESFKRRFGHIGTMLSDILSSFSLDVVGIVTDYMFAKRIERGDKPIHLYSFGDCGVADAQIGESIYAMATSPNNDIWIADTRRVQAFNEEGAFKFCVAK